MKSSVFDNMKATMHEFVDFSFNTLEQVVEEATESSTESKEKGKELLNALKKKTEGLKDQLEEEIKQLGRHFKRNSGLDYITKAELNVLQNRIANLEKRLAMDEATMGDTLDY